MPLPHRAAFEPESGCQVVTVKLGGHLFERVLAEDQPPLAPCNDFLDVFHSVAVNVPGADAGSFPRSEDGRRLPRRQTTHIFAGSAFSRRARRQDVYLTL